MQFLNMTTFVLAIAFSIAGCIGVFGALRRKDMRIGFLSFGMVLFIIAIYWTAMTWQAWSNRSGALDYLLSSLSRVEQGETPLLSPHAGEDKRERVLRFAPQIALPLRSAKYVDFYFGSYAFAIESATGDRYTVLINAYPPLSATQFRKPDFSMHDIDQY